VIYVILMCSVLSLYIKRGKVRPCVRTGTSVRTSVTVGVASSVANDVIVRMTSQ